MKRVPAVVIAAVAAAALAIPAQSAREPTPTGSFLRYRARSVTELESQVRNDPVVRIRYARHFQTSGARVISYFGSNLKLTTLKRPRRVTMYYIGKGGKTSKATKLLPKGSAVFSTTQGELLLSWSCGNPLRARLPEVLARKPKGAAITVAAPRVSVAAKPEVHRTPAQTPEAAPEKPAQEAPVTETLPVVEVFTTAVETAPPAPVVIAPVPTTAPPVVAPMTVPPVAVAPAVVSSRFGLGWLGALGGLGGLAALVGGGGGGSGGPPPVPIAEPSSLAALAFGVASVPAAFRLRRRRQG